MTEPATAPAQHIHLVSDATGETIEGLVKAVLAQFENVETRLHLWPMIRSTQQMQRVMQDVNETPGLVLFTLVNPEIRHILITACEQSGLSHLSVLDPLINTLGQYLGAEAHGRPGRQHQLDASYFRRIDALHYTMDHDDGLITHDLTEADIILVGVSRTSKTPTAIYLANKGYKTANVPFVPEISMPATLGEPPLRFVVGLTTSPERLIQIRQNRIRAINGPDGNSYTDLDRVRREIIACKRFCHRQGWPVIDVSRRSIEETAAEILRLHAQWLDRNDEDPA